jgi:hypothetical protein
MVENVADVVVTMSFDRRYSQPPQKDAHQDCWRSFPWESRIGILRETHAAVGTNAILVASTMAHRVTMRFTISHYCPTPKPVCVRDCGSLFRRRTSVVDSQPHVLAVVALVWGFVHACTPKQTSKMPVPGIPTTPTLISVTLRGDKRLPEGYDYAQVSRRHTRRLVGEDECSCCCQIVGNCWN